MLPPEGTQAAPNISSRGPGLRDASTGKDSQRVNQAPCGGTRHESVLAPPPSMNASGPSPLPLGSCQGRPLPPTRSPTVGKWKKPQGKGNSPRRQTRLSQHVSNHSN